MQGNDLIAKELNEFFRNVVSALNIAENSFIKTRTSDGITDPIDKAIDKFHLSILLIQKHLKNNDGFSLKRAVLGVIEKEINNVNPKKATSNSNIPLKIFLKSLLKFQKLFYINYLAIQ